MAHTVERGIAMNVRSQVASMSVTRTLDAVPLPVNASSVLRSESAVLPEAIANNLSSSVRGQVENALQQGIEEAVDHQMNGRGGIASEVAGAFAFK